jgi:NAD(P)H dehydrogenase (quinone)
LGDHLTFIFLSGGGNSSIDERLHRPRVPARFRLQIPQGQSIPRQALEGRTAHLLVALDTPPWYYRWFYHMPGLHQMRKTTLELCGIKPIKTIMFGPVLALLRRSATSG